MVGLEIGGQAPKCSIWEQYVPIIKNGIHTDVYLTAPIEAPEEYNELCYRLNHAYENETITIHINNGGGWIDSGFMIIDALKSTKAKVTAKLSGTVASASTIIALACDEVITADHTAFMIHNYSGQASGKGNEIKAQMEFTDKSLNQAFMSIYGGFLTENEMELVIAGKDYWLTKEEVEDRLKARKHGDKEELEKLAKAYKDK